MTSQISMEQMEFYAFHGVYSEERTVGARFLVDLTMNIDLKKAGQSDQLEDTINYELVYNVVRAEMKIPSQLIEHVAYRIKNTLTEQFPEIQKLTLKVTKLNPPLGGKIGSVSVTIE